MGLKSIDQAYCTALADFYLDNEVSLTGLNADAEEQSEKKSRPHKKRQKERKNKSLLKAFKPVTPEPDTDHTPSQKEENILPYVLVAAIAFFMLGKQEQDVPSPAPGTPAATTNFTGHFRCSAYPGAGIALEHVEQAPANVPALDMAGQTAKEQTSALVRDPQTGKIADLARISVDSKNCEQAFKTLKERHPAFKAYL